MKKYVCTICGYVFDESQGVLWENLPSDWVCPLCGAEKSAFEIQEAVTKAETNNSSDEGSIETQASEVNEAAKELHPNEIVALCSNLSKGCQKQYLVEESKAFLEIATYFTNNKALKETDQLKKMVEEINTELSSTYKRSNDVLDSNGDRGGKRALVWSEKVTRMLKSIISKYEEVGNSYLENTKIHVCEICGFIYIGNDLPKVCPVCKVPNFKMKEIGRG